jgi:alanyl-tRNA synthetase
LVQIETALAEAKSRPGDKFVLVQDCFRQFDLEKVGADNFHLSLFEMPGAFAFGSNGKPETIRQMWCFARNELRENGVEFKRYF